MNPEAFCVCLVTAPNEDAAAAIARALVEEKLAACANLVKGVRSIYAWEGRVCDDGEVLLIVKTRTALIERVAARVKTLHTYDVPETIALPIVGGSMSYLKWVEESTTP